MTNNNELPQNKTSRLMITTWVCLLWFVFAFCTFVLAIVNNWIILYGVNAYEFPKYRQPYEWLIESIAFSGMLAVPIGFCCGLWVIVFQRYTAKDLIPTLIPTIMLGVLLLAFVVHQYQMYQLSKKWNDNPPVVVPMLSD
jgi:hypothetical protein